MQILKTIFFVTNLFHSVFQQKFKFECPRFKLYLLSQLHVVHTLPLLQELCTTTLKLVFKEMIAVGRNVSLFHWYNRTCTI